MADEPADDPDAPPDAPPDSAVLAYVRGRLPAEEARRLEAEAAARPALAAEIALIRGIVGSLDAEAGSPAPGELGWARLSRAIDAESGRAAAPAPRARPRLWPLAASAAAAVLVWQLAAVPLLDRPGEGGYAPVSEAPTGFTADVVFLPDAPEQAIRSLLRSVDGQVTGGPTALGLWQVGFATAEARDAALEALAAAPIVESVQ